MTRTQRPCPHCGQPTDINAADILAAVAAGKHPLTTSAIAAALRAPADIMSKRLSKLADRGLIKREYFSAPHKGIWRKYAIWSPAKKIAAVTP